MSGLDLTLDPDRQPRPFEVINGAGGRRQWSVDDKARIIAETLEPNAIISEVSRRYGLRPQQVFAWCRGCASAIGGGDGIRIPVRSCSGCSVTAVLRPRP
ncbi:transposase [Mesorhizobium sp. M0664]|uniref:transposase n=1 Tax=Mesorhizobium sp. M0664 TaxID=2956982 RepID=UPI00333CD417